MKYSFYFLFVIYFLINFAECNGASLNLDYTENVTLDASAIEAIDACYYCNHKIAIVGRQCYIFVASVRIVLYIITALVAIYFGVDSTILEFGSTNAKSQRISIVVCICIFEIVAEIVFSIPKYIDKLDQDSEYYIYMIVLLLMVATVMFNILLTMHSTLVSFDRYKNAPYTFVIFICFAFSLALFGILLVIPYTIIDSIECMIELPAIKKLFWGWMPIFAVICAITIIMILVDNENCCKLFDRTKFDQSQSEVKHRKRTQIFNAIALSMECGWFCFFLRPDSHATIALFNIFNIFQALIFFGYQMHIWKLKWEDANARIEPQRLLYGLTNE